MNAVLERYGFPVFDYDTYKHLVGNGTLKLVERALPEKLRSEENIKKSIMLSSLRNTTRDV